MEAWSPFESAAPSEELFASSCPHAASKHAKNNTEISAITVLYLNSIPPIVCKCLNTKKIKKAQANADLITVLV